MKKKAAYEPPRPPRPHAPPLNDEQVAAMTRLSDPDYAMKQATETPTHPQDAAEKPAEARGDPATRIPAPPPTEPLSTVKKTPQKPAKSADVEETPQSTREFPWSNLEGLKKTNLLYEIPTDIVAKMNWVIDNVPRMSRQRIVRDAVAAELDRLVDLYYKP